MKTELTRSEMDRKFEATSNARAVLARRTREAEKLGHRLDVYIKNSLATSEPMPLATLNRDKRLIMAAMNDAGEISRLADSRIFTVQESAVAAENTKAHDQIRLATDRLERAMAAKNETEITRQEKAIYKATVTAAEAMAKLTNKEGR